MSTSAFQSTPTRTHHTLSNLLRFCVYSSIGLFFFFVPISYNGTSSIPVDHLVSIVSGWIGSAALPYVVLGIVVFGALRPFFSRAWYRSRTSITFTIVGVLGMMVSSMVVFNVGPGWLLDEGLAPYLYRAVASSVAILVPVGSIFLCMLTAYGLMEFIGVFAQRVMRPIWKTPGRSAVDAVASFVASYSLSMLITDRMYREGKYTGREASIIAVGFSTVSVMFMVVIANTLGIMEHWLVFFFLSLVVTFTVTAISVRLPPLRSMPDETYNDVPPVPEEIVTSQRFKVALNNALEVASSSPGLFRNVIGNFWLGLKMAGNIVPSIMAIGTLTLALTNYTTIFGFLGYIFVPFMWIVGISDPLFAGEAAVLSLTEIFLPAALVAGHEDLTLRMLIAVISVSAIVFFSALIPTVKATTIPISIWQMVQVWFVRVALTILIATPMIHLIVWLL